MRVSYKSMWKTAKLNAAMERDRRKDAEHELGRLNAILAQEGAEIVKDIPIKGSEVIRFAPLPYECIKASMLQNLRFTQTRTTGLCPNLMWRAHRLEVRP